jgi:hypothetical protein
MSSIPVREIINADNLKILLQFLKDNYDMVERQLDMESFCSISANPQRVAEKIDQWAGDTPCGTTLCLAGWTAAIPEFHKETLRFRDYSRLIDEVYSKENFVFSYLFNSDWDNCLDDGISRIERLIRAVDEEDERFIEYLREYSSLLVDLYGIDGDNLWESSIDEAPDDVEIDTQEEALAAFPLYETPDWF